MPTTAFIDLKTESQAVARNIEKAFQNIANNTTIDELNQVATLINKDPGKIAKLLRTYKSNQFMINKIMGI